MKNIKRIEEIKRKIEEIEKELNTTALEFIEEYELTKIKYLDDAINEFADGKVNIYYKDIWDYYKNHMDESKDALDEYGYTLKDFATLDEVIEKGSQLAQYTEIYNEVMENEEELEELTELYEELEELEKDE